MGGAGSEVARGRGGRGEGGSCHPHPLP